MSFIQSVKKLCERERVWAVINFLHLLEDFEGLSHGAGTAVTVDEVLSSVTENKENVEHLFL